MDPSSSISRSMSCSIQVSLPPCGAAVALPDAPAVSLCTSRRDDGVADGFFDPACLRGCAVVSGAMLLPDGTTVTPCEPKTLPVCNPQPPAQLPLAEYGVETGAEAARCASRACCCLAYLAMSDWIDMGPNLSSQSPPQCEALTLTAERPPPPGSAPPRGQPALLRDDGRP